MVPSHAAIARGGAWCSAGNASRDRLTTSRPTIVALATPVHLGFDRMAANLNQVRQELGERIDTVEAEIRSLRLTAQTSAAGEEISGTSARSTP